MLKKKSLTSAILGMGVLAFLSVGCEQVSGPSQDQAAARQKAKDESPAKDGAGITVEKTRGGPVVISDTGTVVTDGSITLTEVSGAPKDCTGSNPVLVVGSDSLVVSGTGVVEVDSTSVTVHPTPIDPGHVRPMTP